LDGSTFARGPGADAEGVVVEEPSGVDADSVEVGGAKYNEINRHSENRVSLMAYPLAHLRQQEPAAGTLGIEVCLF
jgi:hypothetical protein